MSALNDHVVLFGRKWRYAVVYLLYSKSKRFSEIMAGLNNCSTKVLSEVLKDLEASGLLTRTVIDAKPPYALYKLTDRARVFIPLIEEIDRVTKKFSSN